MSTPHVPTTPSPESTDYIPKWSLEDDDEDDERQQQHQLQYPSPEATEDNDYFFFNQQTIILGSLDDDLLPSTPHDGDDFYYGMPIDSTYETATRIFYATMQKFGRPTSQRSFLESWHLHSMYSKSQQILLGIPNAQSIVYLSGDDFMYTPQFVPQEPVMDQMECDWEDSTHDEFPAAMEEERDCGGIMVMTAPAPVIDENLWMAPDKDVSGISLDALNYYRNGPQSTDEHNHAKEIIYPPPTEEVIFNRDEGVQYYNQQQYPNEEKNEGEGNDNPQLQKEPVLQQHEELQCQHEPSSLVQTTSRAIIQENFGHYGTVKGQQEYQNTSDDMALRLLRFSVFSSSETLVNHLLLAFELAEEFAETKGCNTITTFFIYLARIWQMLFLCAEIMLNTLGDCRHHHVRNDAWV